MAVENLWAPWRMEFIRDLGGKPGGCFLCDAAAGARRPQEPRRPPRKNRPLPAQPLPLQQRPPAHLARSGTRARSSRSRGEELAEVMSITVEAKKLLDRADRPARIQHRRQPRPRGGRRAGRAFSPAHRPALVGRHELRDHRRLDQGHPAGARRTVAVAGRGVEKGAESPVLNREEIEKREERELAPYAMRSGALARARARRAGASRCARPTSATASASSTPPPSAGWNTRRRSSSTTRATTTARG